MTADNEMHIKSNTEKLFKSIVFCPHTRDRFLFEQADNGRTLCVTLGSLLVGALGAVIRLRSAISRLCIIPEEQYPYSRRFVRFAVNERVACARQPRSGGTFVSDQRLCAERSLRTLLVDIGKFYHFITVNIRCPFFTRCFGFAF